MDSASTDSQPQSSSAAETHGVEWSRAYWVLLVNQTLVVAVLAWIAATLLHQSYETSKAADLYPPGLTKLYFALGPAMLALVGLASVVVSLAASAWRRQFIAVVVTTLSFVGCVVVLVGAALASFAPLVIAIHNMLPPDLQ